MHAECSMNNTPCIDAHCVQACYEHLFAGKQPPLPSDEPEQHSPLKRGRKRKMPESFQAALEEAEQAAASDGEMETAAQPQHFRPLVCFTSTRPSWFTLHLGWLLLGVTRWGLLLHQGITVHSPRVRSFRHCPPRDQEGSGRQAHLVLQTGGLLRGGTELPHAAHGRSEGAAARWQGGRGVVSPQAAPCDEDLLSGGSPSEGSAAGDHTAARHQAQACWQSLHPVGECAAEAGALLRALHHTHPAGNHGVEAEAPPGAQHEAQAFQHPLRPALERATRAEAQHQARSGMEPLPPAEGPAAEGEGLREAQHQAHTSQRLLHPAGEPRAGAKALSKVQQGTETAPTKPAAPVGASNAAAAEAVPVPPTSAPARGRLVTAAAAAAKQRRKQNPARQARALPKQQVPDVATQAGQYRQGAASKLSSAPAGAGQAAAAATAVTQLEAGPQGSPSQAQPDSALQHAWNRAFPLPAPSEGLMAAIAALEAGDNGTLGAILNPTGKLRLLCSQGCCHCPVLVQSHALAGSWSPAMVSICLPSTQSALMDLVIFFAMLPERA